VVLIILITGVIPDEWTMKKYIVNTIPIKSLDEIFQIQERKGMIHVSGMTWKRKFVHPTIFISMTLRTVKGFIDNKYLSEAIETIIE
jgi:hypothetical protein